MQIEFQTVAMFELPVYTEDADGIYCYQRIGGENWKITISTQNGTITKELLGDISKLSLSYGEKLITRDRFTVRFVNAISRVGNQMRIEFEGMQ
jgi:hypothetical protein